MFKNFELICCSKLLYSSYSFDNLNFLHSPGHMSKIPRVAIRFMAQVRSPIGQVRSGESTPLVFLLHSDLKSSDQQFSSKYYSFDLHRKGTDFLFIYSFYPVPIRLMIVAILLFHYRKKIVFTLKFGSLLNQAQHIIFKIQYCLNLQV